MVIKALRKEMKSLGMTSKDLAEAVGVTESAVKKWLGGGSPKPVHVVKMKELGISVDAAIYPSKEIDM